jgi:hypothetical protein
VNKPGKKLMNIRKKDIMLKICSAIKKKQNNNFFFLISFLLFAIGILSQTTPCFAQLPPNPVKAPDELKSILRKDHPRIFINSEIFPAIKARALNEEAELFSAMKKRIDILDPEKAEFKDYGIQSAEAAFVYLVTGDDIYLAKTKKLLKKSIEYYMDCYNRQTPVNWYAYTQTNAWAAYDWIFNRLTEDEKRELALPFLNEVEKIQPTTARHYFYPQENWSGPTTGFYGNPSLLWYTGLALFGEGIDDTRAETFLAEGYRLNMELLAHRSKCAGDDGGSASACQNYVMADYPWAEYNFFHTFRSATGKNIATDWPYASFLPGYLYWNMLPGQLEFGVGDAPHITNKISLSNMRTHLLQIINFYGDTNPRCAAFSKWMIGQVPTGNYGSFPYLPFLLTERRDDVNAIGPETVMPHARHFEKMGQIFMHSGAGPDDTYALFMAGGIIRQHKHWDSNQFLIYKKGFLALDTGSRPAPGTHTQVYFPRTIAHNCILIAMPGEEFPEFADGRPGWGQRWGAPAPGEEEPVIQNDGGQNEYLGSKVTAFETNDEYSYIAGDATGSYSVDKCSLVLRQFVFLNPDYFVIFDRVISTSSEYKKTWLLHTATEPIIEKSIISETQGKGKLFSRTLLPENAVIKKIGGPGKQFWSGCRNWPMPNNTPPDTTQLLGQWRIEVSPEVSKNETQFLHLIQVGDLSMTKMVKSNLVRKGKQSGVRFSSGARTWEVMFGTSGGATGRISIQDSGKMIVDRDLTGKIMPQKGLFGTD